MGPSAASFVAQRLKTSLLVTTKDQKKEGKITRVSGNSQANVIGAVLWIKELYKGNNPQFEQTHVSSCILQLMTERCVTL